MTDLQCTTFWACFIGWALDAIDVQLFAFEIPTVLGAWHVSESRVGLIGTTAFVTSAIGGFMAAALADRIGGERVLQITII